MGRVAEKRQRRITNMLLLGILVVLVLMYRQQRLDSVQAFGPWEEEGLEMEHGFHGHPELMPDGEMRS